MFARISMIAQSTKYKEQSRMGFTLIELLVVISVIGILASFGFSRFILAEKQARDAMRKSDLNQYRVALENFAAANNLTYPVPSCGSVANLCATNNFQTIYLSGGCLQDPRAEVSTYQYCSSSTGSQYAVWATLESGGYFEACSNGKSGKLSTEPVFTNGACSL